MPETETETIVVDGSSMPVLVEEPHGPGPFPGVLVTHHGPGVDEFTHDFVHKLADAGYVAAAPNFYHRVPETAEIPEKVAALDDLKIIADIDATVEFMDRLFNVQSERLAIAGHCLGGRNAFLGAAANSEFKACGVFYGGNIMVGRGRDHPTPFELIEKINCAVIGLFGGNDENPSPADVDKIDDEMTRLGKPHEFHRYDGAGHAFQNFTDDSRFHRRASEDAGRKLLRFFDAALKG